MSGFDLPDNDAAFDANQSRWMSTDIDILTAGLNGVGVISGCAVTAQGSPDMTVAIAAGTIRIASGLLVTVTAGNGTITTADGTNPRIDLVSASDTGTKTVTAGTAAANPKAPGLPSGHVGLAMVYVPPSDTTIAANQITDKRVILPTHSLQAANYDPDRYPASVSLSDEFDDGSVHADWGWSGTAPTYNETEYPGFLYVAITAAADPGKFRRAYSPGASTAFTVVVKGSYACYDSTTIVGGFGIGVLDSSDATIALLSIVGDATSPRWDNQRLSINGSLTTIADIAGGDIYLMITRDASNNYAYLYSYNGRDWHYVGTSSSATTVAKVAILNNTNVGNYSQSVDFIRAFTGSITRKIGS